MSETVSKTVLLEVTAPPSSSHCAIVRDIMTLVWERDDTPAPCHLFAKEVTNVSVTAHTASQGDILRTIR